MEDIQQNILFTGLVFLVSILLLKRLTPPHPSYQIIPQEKPISLIKEVYFFFSREEVFRFIYLFS